MTSECELIFGCVGMVCSTCGVVFVVWCCRSEEGGNLFDKRGGVFFVRRWGLWGGGEGGGRERSALQKREAQFLYLSEALWGGVREGEGGDPGCKQKRKSMCTKAKKRGGGDGRGGV